MPKVSTLKSKEPSSLKRPFTRRDFLSTSLKIGTAAFTTALLPKSQVNAKGQYNILFIFLDDLRPLLGCYGHPEIHTPNIDGLAQRGTLFNRAYCQNPLCHPSRTSMLTGLRPETTGVLSNAVNFREKLPNAVTLPQHFKAYGYHTASIGKIEHNALARDDAYSWSVPSWVPPWIPFNPLHIPAWQSLDVKDNDLSDGRTAEQAVAVLAELQDTQFFLAVGFEKPHLPFYAPKKYYELYAQVDFTLPPTSMLPAAAPAIANNHLGGLREYKDIPDQGPLSETKILELIRAYAASTSYMDAQVGRVLQQLDTLGLSENTVVVFVGDHGFHLGEHVSRAGTRGRSIRTTQYRYTEWGSGGRRGKELYDYDADPDETVNIADLPENAELVANLSEQLRAGWRAALPDIQEQVVFQTLPWDINDDGIVNIEDLILVSNGFGIETPQHPKADVNKDGRIDIIDLLLVAAHFGECSEPASPQIYSNIRPEHLGLIDEWLTEARVSDDGSDVFRHGIETLEHLINTAIPTRTVLLPNYPNPFNPETWIPYDLARDADVRIHIYNMKGESVRQLSIGFQTAGTYRTRSHAVYWDGRNAIGEAVASGIYFYTFQAGQFRVTRQMVILK